jgi:hypothetical protein
MFAICSYPMHGNFVLGFAAPWGYYAFCHKLKDYTKWGIPMSQGDSLVAEEIMHLCPSYEPTTLCLTKAVVVSSHVLG